MKPPWEPVDLALVIALDGSASTRCGEFNLIANGMGAVLRDQAVIAGLIHGPHRAAMVSFLLWSSINDQDVLVDWIRIVTTAASRVVAEEAENVPRTIRAGGTALGEALAPCHTLLAGAPAPASRRVVDIAGDDRPNEGPPAPNVAAQSPPASSSTACEFGLLRHLVVKWMIPAYFHCRSPCQAAHALRSLAAFGYSNRATITVPM